MPQDEGLDIESKSDTSPDGAPKPGAKPKNTSPLEGAGIEDGVAGTGGGNKVQDQ